MIYTMISTAISSTAAEDVHTVRHEAGDQDHDHDRENRNEIAIVARSHQGTSGHERLQRACQTEIPLRVEASRDDC